MSPATTNVAVKSDNIPFSSSKSLSAFPLSFAARDTTNPSNINITKIRKQNTYFMKLSRAQIILMKTPALNSGGKSDISCYVQSNASHPCNGRSTLQEARQLPPTAPKGRKPIGVAKDDKNIFFSKLTNVQLYIMTKSLIFLIMSKILNLFSFRTSR